MRKRQQAPGELEHVRAFLNTVDFEQHSDELSDSPALARWLSEHGLASPGVRATPADLERAVSLREALRAALLDHNGVESVPAPDGTLDQAARRAKLRLRFAGGGSARLEPEATGVDGALGRLLVIVYAAINDGSWQRLKACRLDSCHWAFYDHTKNRSGAWCTMEVCGNRAKARTYRERQAAGR